MAYGFLFRSQPRHLPITCFPESPRNSWITWHMSSSLAWLAILSCRKDTWPSLSHSYDDSSPLPIYKKNGTLKEKRPRKKQQRKKKDRDLYGNNLRSLRPSQIIFMFPLRWCTKDNCKVFLVHKYLILSGMSCRISAYVPVW